jgi:integrase
MRQGECLGLTVDRLDFLRRVVHVDRQLVTVTGRPSFLTAPKTAASVRTIPLPQVVLDALAAHLGAFPPLGDGFVFVTAAGNPIRRTAFGMCGGLPSSPRARRVGRAFIRCGISMPAC